MACVYWITPDIGDDFRKQGYIGITSNTLHKRMFAHRTQYSKFCEGDNKVGCKKLYSYVKQHGGWENLHIKILCEGSTEYCLELEEKLRPIPNIGWNTRVGGDKHVMYQRKFTDETRKRLAAVRQTWVMCEETRQIMSEQRTGKGNPMFGVKPWNNGSATKISKLTWFHAEEIYKNWCESRSGVKVLSRSFPALNYHTIDSMIRKFRKGWIPHQDICWLQYRNEYNE